MAPASADAAGKEDFELFTKLHELMQGSAHMKRLLKYGLYIAGGNMVAFEDCMGFLSQTSS